MLKWIGVFALALLTTAVVNGQEVFRNPEVLAWVACDGNGGFMFSENPNFTMDRESTLCTCVAEHEQEHIDYLQHFFTDLCRGKTEGHKPRVEVEIRKITECYAYYVMRQCFFRYGELREAREYWLYAKKTFDCEMDIIKPAYKENLRQRKDVRYANSNLHRPDRREPPNLAKGKRTDVLTSIECLLDSPCDSEDPGAPCS